MESRENTSLQPLSRTLRFSQARIKVVCLKCGTPFEAFNMGNWTRKYCNPCAEEKAKEDAEVIARAKKQDELTRYLDIIARARIPADLRETTFANADPKINEKIFAWGQQYAETFSPHQSRSLLMTSRTTGTGKTYLAACIANHVLHEKKLSVRFQDAQSLLLDIRNTYSEDRLSEAQVLDQVLRVDLLVLDDVGWAPKSEWIEGIYANILNRRIHHELPVIVTTNYPFEDDGRGQFLRDRIGERAYSRLKAMCGGAIIRFPGKDLR